MYTPEENSLKLTRDWGDPLFYIPLEAIKAASGEIKIESEEKGFKAATLHSSGKAAQITIFETGPLKGLVKLPSDSLGKVLPVGKMFAIAAI